MDGSETRQLLQCLAGFWGPDDTGVWALPGEALRVGGSGQDRQTFRFQLSEFPASLPGVHTLRVPVCCLPVPSGLCIPDGWDRSACSSLQPRA